MNLITMVPATARFIAQMRGMRRYIVENNVTEFSVFQNWCDENNERWAEALDSGCAIAIEKFIADWNGRADANRWKHAAQPDDNIWDKGHFHPSFRFVKAKRYNAKPHVLIELDGETLADINGRSKYYEGFSRCVDRKPEEGAWIEPTEFGMMFLSILDLGMSEEEAEKIGIPITQTWKRISRSRY